MIAPCPAISRGTDSTVPIIPGLVSVTVVPSKSSGVILPERTLRITSSYAAWNPAKSSEPAFSDVRDEQRARAVLALHVDGEAEVDDLCRTTCRLAVQLLRSDEFSAGTD